MPSFKVDPDTVADTGLNFRNAPTTDASSLIGLLQPGDIVEATGDAQNAGSIVWLPVRVVNSSKVAAGATGYVALSAGNQQFLQTFSDGSSLADAVAHAAEMMQLPPLLLKAFLAVEGANVNHPDGVLQVTAGTRPGVIRRIPRALKLAALGLNEDPILNDDDLNARFAQSYTAKNLLVQVLTGAQFIQEQINSFYGFVALAGLAYNAGSGKAREVINTFGGDPYHAALQYHKTIGTGVDQVTVQPGIVQIDPATGAQWTRYPVTANDTGKEIFQYLYMRQVPGRNYGLLDFIFRPKLLVSLGLYEGDAPPGDDTGKQALLVAGGQFVLKGDESVKTFNTLPLSQRDPQWKDITLGFGDASSTIGAYGCTLVCLTMAANGMGYDETPATLNAKLKALGPNAGYIGPLMVFSGLPAALPGIQFKNFVRCRDVPAPLADIDAALDAGDPVVVEVDYSPNPGLQNHWVLLYARQASDYLIHDPWPVPAEPSASLAQRYGFAGSPAQIITTVVYYTGQNPVAAAPYFVVVNDDPDITDAAGLALRDAPLTGNVLERLPCGTVLQSVEPASMALQKVGQLGQWLNVKNADGRVGYVAAWMIHAQSAAPVPAPKDAGQSTSPIPVDPALVGVTQAPLRDPKALNAVIVRVVDNADIAWAGGLALRISPVSGTIKTRLPAGTLLNVREPIATALAKIGQMGQWLNVITAGSVQGFVAAWYVEPAQAAVASAAPLSAPQPPPAISLPEPSSPTPIPALWAAPSAPVATVAPIQPEVIAQGVVIASADTPLYDSPPVRGPAGNPSGGSMGGPSSWRVTAGTPLRVTESGAWAAKLGRADQFVKVQSYAFKEGYVQASMVGVPSDVDRRAPIVDALLPRGLSAWLYGLHDRFERSLFAGSGKSGWVLMNERVASGAGKLTYSDWTYNGYGVIVRLNNDYRDATVISGPAVPSGSVTYSGTIPTPDKRDAFASLCAKWVLNSVACNIWVIGNEMNNPREWPEEGRNPEKAITPESYAACFNLVRAAIKAVQPNAIVVPGALDPYQASQMSSLEWFNRMLAAINDLDGIALHCYTQGYTPALITDLGRCDEEPLRWQYRHFRAYSTFLDVIPAKWRNRPVFITETAARGDAPWSGEQNGWVQAAYAEINRWNQQPFAQQIRSLILYRWEQGDPYSLINKPAVQNDIRLALKTTDYRWKK